MSSFCEFCGNRVEDGAVCNCPAATQARGGAQPPPAYAPPPPPPQGASGGYAPPPPQPGYPPQGQYPPAQGYPPQYGQQPYGQQPYGYGPPPGQAGQQVKQTFGEVKGILSGFVKDPYGAAVRGNSLGVTISVILLAVQAVAYFLFDFSVTNKYFADATDGMDKEQRKALMERMGPEFGDYVKVFIAGAAVIGLFFLVIFLATKIAKIAMDPKAMLSNVAMSSIPISAAFVVLAVLMFLLGVGDDMEDAMFRMAIYFAVWTFAAVCSTLLLEIGLRSAVPPGTGNVARIFALAASYAVTYAVLLIVMGNMDEPIGFMSYLL